MNTNINIELSETSVKWIVGGACFLGFCYLTYKLFELQQGGQIPLPDEARDFANMRSVTPVEFDQIGYHDGIKNMALPAFKAGDYQGAVRAAVVALFELIRKKSGLMDDATSLIQKTFRGKEPKLKFRNVAPIHVTNVEDGLIQMLEGVAKSFRKIHMHAEVSLTKTEALQEINIVCYLANKVDRNTCDASKI